MVEVAVFVGIATILRCIAAPSCMAVSGQVHMACKQLDLSDQELMVLLTHPSLICQVVVELLAISRLSGITSTYLSLSIVSEELLTHPSLICQVVVELLNEHLNALPMELLGSTIDDLWVCVHDCGAIASGTADTLAK
jgi:hypothetical protein